MKVCRNSRPVGGVVARLALPFQLAVYPWDGLIASGVAMTSITS